ncbi:caspase family protein [Rhizobium leguminosarum]|uniref:caspase family protein n=1 Tax=Rhizobium leguminosarum TaxID=384 RepID=UPI003516B121
MNVKGGFWSCHFLVASLALAILTLSLSALRASDNSPRWTYPPSAVVKPDTMELSYLDEEDNESHILYSESHAVLIMQGSYAPPWTSAEPGALAAEHLLTDALKARHFVVEVWRNLSSKQLGTVVAEALSNYSYSDNGRLFFYYYGHGVTIGGPDDPGGSQFFLVPVDAPSSVNESEFVKKAFSGATLMSYVRSLRLKHAFFAFEACRSGGILSTLSDPPAPNPQGYLRNPRVQQWVRQFSHRGQ